MKVLIDLNVMLDFLQRREPFFDDAAYVMDAVLYGKADGVVPAHAVTTIHYFLSRGTEKQGCGEVMRWLLDAFEVAPCNKDLLLRALSLAMLDYEDAVTALSAERTGCSHVVTRNTRDFAESPVPALLPSDFLELLRRG